MPAPSGAPVTPADIDYPEELPNVFPDLSPRTITALIGEVLSRLGGRRRLQTARLAEDSDDCNWKTINGRPVCLGGARHGTHAEGARVSTDDDGVDIQIVRASNPDEGQVTVFRTPKMYLRASIKGDTAEVHMVRNEAAKARVGERADQPAPKDFLRLMRALVREARAKGATRIVADIVHPGLAKIVAKVGGREERRYTSGPQGPVGHLVTHWVLPLDNPALAEALAEWAEEYALDDADWPAFETWASLYRYLHAPPRSSWRRLAEDETDEGDACHWVTIRGNPVCIGGERHQMHAKGEPKPPRSEPERLPRGEPRTGAAPVAAPPSGTFQATIPKGYAGHTEGVRVRTVEEAYNLLTNQQKVILAKPEMVSTLLDKLAAIGEQAKAAGKKAPKVNLCNVSVEGSNIFCLGNRGISRVAMPQLRGKAAPGSLSDALPKSARGNVNLGPVFTDDLVQSGVKVAHERLSADRLKSTQNQLDGIKVAGIMKRMEQGTFGDEETIFVSKDGYVIDGHHRWAAQVGRDFRQGQPSGETKVLVTRVDLPILQVLVRAHQFAEKWGVGASEYGACELIDEMRRVVARLAAQLPYGWAPPRPVLLDVGETLRLDPAGIVEDGPPALLGVTLPALE
jgi:hypothetical protein